MAGAATDPGRAPGAASDLDWSAAPVWTSRLASLRNVVRQELAALVGVEEELGRRDPHRLVAPLFHLVARQTR